MEEQEGQRVQRDYQGVYGNISLTTPSEADLIKFFLEGKKEVEDGLIEYLAKVRWGKTPNYETVWSNKLKKNITILKGERDAWLPIAETIHPLMDLVSAKEIAAYVGSEVGDVLHSTSYISPETRTYLTAATVGLIVGQMLDNPRYNFRGNETDVRAIVYKVCRGVDESLGRSKGAIFLKQTMENTQNIQHKDIVENAKPQSMKTPGTFQKYFGVKK